MFFACVAFSICLDRTHKPVTGLEFRDMGQLGKNDVTKQECEGLHRCAGVEYRSWLRLRGRVDFSQYHSGDEESVLLLWRCDDVGRKSSVR